LTFGSLLKILGSVGKYTAVATQAVHEAEVIGGPGATKKEIATALTVAGVHAGETVGIPQVQAAAQAVELAFGIASILGAFGAPKPGAVVQVPAIEVGDEK
jgi:hypothetical protein